MPLEIYHFNNSVCSEKVRLVLCEKGITDWKSHEVDLFKGGQFDFRFEIESKGSRTHACRRREESSSNPLLLPSISMTNFPAPR